MTGDSIHGDIGDFLQRLGADAGAPGAGAAGAFALALGAACARKAARLSARRAPDDPILASADEELASHVEEALVLGAEDGRCLEAHLAEKSAVTAADLERCGQSLLSLAARIDAQVTQLQGRVGALLAGDLVAASALVAAARTVQNRNLDETQATPRNEIGGEAFRRQLQASGWTAAALARELDVDSAMVDAWCKGREAPPRVVALALADLVARHRPRAAAASEAAATPVIGGTDRMSWNEGGARR